MTIKEGEDDSTTVFHPQRFALRPPVVNMSKVWDMYPTHWPEVYYSLHLSDVGLDHDLGQRQIELLHDRRSDIKIKMFAPCNANIGRGGFKTTSLKSAEDGATEFTTKDDWAKVASMNELMMALDNLVPAWTCLWPCDRSMVIIRRVVTKNKEFLVIRNSESRLKHLEMFINKMLEINQRRAIQRDLPMTFKEGHELAKEYLEDMNTFSDTRNFNQPSNKNKSNWDTKHNNYVGSLSTVDWMRKSLEPGGEEGEGERGLH